MKITSIIKYIMSFLLICGITSCNKLTDIDNISDGVDGNDSNLGYVKDALELETVFSPTSYISWQEGIDMGVFVSDTLMQDRGGCDLYNIKASYMKGKWHLEQDVRLEANEMNVYSYIPYKAGKAFDSLYIETGMEDVPLWAKSIKPVKKGNPVASMRMETPMTAVRIKVRKDNMPELRMLQSIRIYNDNKGLPVKGNMSLLNGKISILERGELFIDNMNKVLTENFSDEVSAKFLTLPTNANDPSSKTMLEIKINDKLYKTELNNKVSSWERGLMNEIAVTFKGGKVMVEDFLIKEWITNPSDIDIEWR